MKKRAPKRARIMRMLEAGTPPKVVAKQLGIAVGSVYSARHKHNQSLGIGSLGSTQPQVTDGIGEPPRKKRVLVRRPDEGTGINVPAKPMPTSNQIEMFEPPSLLSRAWTRLVNLVRVLSGG